MDEIKNINELADLQKMIAEKTKNRIETGISEIEGSIEMLRDIDSIISVLIKECDDRQSRIEILENDKISLEKQIAYKEQEIRDFNSDKDRYQQFEDGAVNITNILSALQKDREKIEIEKKQFADDKENFENEKIEFEEEKEKLIESTKAAKDRAEELKKECNNQSKKIDELTVTVQKLNEKKKKLEVEIDELNEDIDQKDALIEEKEKEYSEQLSQLKNDYEDKLFKKEVELDEKEEEISKCEKDRELYRKYALDQDKKIFDYFKKYEKNALENHYKTYLDNKEKENERRELFGAEGVFTTKSDIITKDCIEKLGPESKKNNGLFDDDEEKPVQKPKCKK